jgi:hypothetical protein
MPPFDAFWTTREYLLKGDINNAQQNAGGMSSGNLGTFQYMSALNMVIRKDLACIERAKHKEKVFDI